MKKTLPFLLTFLIAAAIDAQVIVAPTILFMGGQSPFGTFLVMNKSLVPQEITVSFRFGFPESDSLGNVSMQYDDSLMASEHSCQSWVRGFPQRFIINPGQQQVVRLLATPPADLAEGEYWTRLVTSSTPQAKTIDTVKTGITASITFVLQQVTTVIYKKGDLNTSVSLAGVKASADSASMNLIVELARTGNSPFFGTVDAAVKNPADSVVYKDAQVVAVYRNSMYVKIAVPLKNLHPGSYAADIKVTSDRNDIPPEDLLKITPIEKTIKFSVE